MCGIAGLIGLAGVRPTGAAIQAMAEAIAHRGPDDRGFLGWDGSAPPRLVRDAESLGPSRLLFAQLRLSIIDISADGWQPMATEDGRYAIIFNGEIYNYRELKAELERLGWTFRSTSDTEVLLKAWVQWGPQVLPRLVGMFAFAILDTTSKRLVLARDPFGIKPLYWTRTATGLAFASEIKALLAEPTAPRRVAAQPLYDFLLFAGTERDHRTLFEGIERLPPAHWAEIDLDDGRVIPRRYWAIDPDRRTDCSFAEAATHLRELFLDAVALHLRADVPVGAALSGGIDSSAVVMAMRALEGESLDIHAFSFVAEDAAINEERWIDLAGTSAKATVHKLRLSPEELARDLDAIIAVQDEPFGTTSIAAQYGVFRLARESGIKVTLDGQGADEMLGGYPTFFAARLASLMKAGRFVEAHFFARRASRRTGYPLKGLILRSGRWLLPEAWQAGARRLVGEDLTPSWLNAAWFADRGAALAEHPPQAGRAVLKATLLDSFTVRSLPALLRFEDRNSMAHSVESRVPFLTPALAEFTFSLPEDYLIAADGTTKAVFRAAMRGLVPDAILDRPDKIGFATPQSRWLTAIAPWVERVLGGETARAIPALDHAAMIRLWDSVKKSGQTMPPAMWRWLNLIRWAELTGATF